jgi:hypothetical protein
MSKQVSEEMIKESRRYERIRCSEGTHFLARKRLYEGTIKNISKGGTYIETDGYFTVGQEVTVAGTFDAGGRETKQRGAIVRKDGRGIGVKFKKTYR